MDRALFRDAARALGVSVDDAQLDTLARFRDLLEAGNERAKLTSVTGEAGFWRMHALDSLSLVRALAGEPPPRTLVDVGSGAGIPAIPLAIAFPALEVAAIESVEKKGAFIREAAAALGLAPRLRVIVARAEEAGRDPALRDAFDVAVARAVAELAVIAEYCLPFVRPGGIFVAYKGPKVEDELRGGRKACGELAARIEEMIPSGVPDSQLRLVKVRKLRPTPKAFPRKTGLPGKRPLG